MSDLSDQYMTLLGDKPHTPLRKAFFQAADFKAGLMATGIAYFIDMQFPKAGHNPVEDTVEIALGNFGFLVFGRYLDETYIEFSEEDILTKAVNTAPDEDTERSAAHQELARQSRNSHILAATLIVGSVGAVSTLLIAFNNPLVAMQALCSITSHCVRLTKGIHRFNQIAKGEWTIESMPKEKAPEKEKSRALLLTPSLKNT